MEATLRELAQAAATAWRAWMDEQGFDNDALDGMTEALEALETYLEDTELT